MTAAPAAGAHLGTLTSSVPRSDGSVVSLPLSGLDALWLARSIVGESQRDALAVGSTLLRRWCFVNDQRKNAGSSLLWPTFTDLVRAYSQPVNPAWADRGTEQQIARRARITGLSWAEIPESVRTVVLGLLGGRVPLSKPGAIHFADTRVSRTFMANNPGAKTVGDGHNTFLSLPASRSYPEPRVVRGPDSPPLPPSKGPLLAGCFVLLVLL